MGLLKVIKRLFGISRGEIISQNKEDLGKSNDIIAESQLETKITLPDTSFPSPILDDIIKTLVKWQGLEAWQNNENTEWKIQSNSIVDAVVMFYKLDEVDMVNIVSNNQKGRNLFMRMNVCHGRSIELTDMGDNQSDIAEIRYVELGRTIYRIRFVRNLK